MKVVLAIFLFVNIAFALDGKELASKLNLVAGYKAIIQWEKVFNNQRKMKKYKIVSLSKDEQKLLKKYLIEHAVDSDEPEIAGNEGI